jgi:hypothetical protein
MSVTKPKKHCQFLALIFSLCAGVMPAPAAAQTPREMRLEPYVFESADMQKKEQTP